MLPPGVLLDAENAAAFGLFLVGWIAYSVVVDRGFFSRQGLSQRMNRQRSVWMQTLLLRDLRMIDTAIIAGLQQGTGFFASACIFAIGGCFALLGSGDTISSIVADLPLQSVIDRSLVESKLLGLVTVFAYAFFQFGWAYRLFNYCSILVGAIPMRNEAELRPDVAERALLRAATMNQIAARHFNGGLRAIYFGIAFLGWFIGPYVLMATTTCVLVMLVHRQFFSDARDCVADDASISGSPS